MSNGAINRLLSNETINRLLNRLLNDGNILAKVIVGFRNFYAKLNNKKVDLLVYWQ